MAIVGITIAMGLLTRWWISLAS